MRLLDKSNLKPDINKLGLIDEELEKLKGLINRPHGIIRSPGRQAPVKVPPCMPFCRP